MSFVFLEEHENVLDMYTEDNHIPKKKNHIGLHGP